jgi:hypothetical protein
LGTTFSRTNFTGGVLLASTDTLVSIELNEG